MIKLRLFNGATTPEAWNADSTEFIDDWKPEQRILDVDSVQVTYGCHVKVYGNPDVEELFWNDNDLIEYDGCYFGDFEVCAE